MRLAWLLLLLAVDYVVAQPPPSTTDVNDILTTDMEPAVNGMKFNATADDFYPGVRTFVIACVCFSVSLAPLRPQSLLCRLRMGELRRMVPQPRSPRMGRCGYASREENSDRLSRRSV